VPDRGPRSEATDHLQTKDSMSGADAAALPGPSENLHAAEGAASADKTRTVSAPTAAPNPKARAESILDLCEERSQ